MLLRACRLMRVSATCPPAILTAPLPGEAAAGCVKAAADDDDAARTALCELPPVTGRRCCVCCALLCSAHCCPLFASCSRMLLRACRLMQMSATWPPVTFTAGTADHLAELLPAALKPEGDVPMTPHLRRALICASCRRTLLRACLLRTPGKNKWPHCYRSSLTWRSRRRLHPVWCGTTPRPFRGWGPEARLHLLHRWLIARSLRSQTRKSTVSTTPTYSRIQGRAATQVCNAED